MEDCIELQNALIDTHGVNEFLHQMAVIATRQVASDLSCAMTMRPNGRPATVACSDEVAAKVDGVQYRLDDGPCLHAMRVGEMVTIEDTADQARWPAFEAEAAAAGIRSCLAIPLKSLPYKESAQEAQAKETSNELSRDGDGDGDAPPMGALNLYARSASAFGEAEKQRAEGFAETASGALVLARRLASYADLNEQLRASLMSRSVIDQALGIVMARGGIGFADAGPPRHCTQARAFELLRAASQNTNTKLRDIARAIVSSVTGEPVQAPPPFEDPKDPVVAS